MLCAMQPACSTATTRPGNGPGIPGFEVDALLCTWPRAAAPANAADRRKSRRRVVMHLILQGLAGGCRCTNQKSPTPRRSGFGNLLLHPLLFELFVLLL